MKAIEPIITKKTESTHVQLTISYYELALIYSLLGITQAKLSSELFTKLHFQHLKNICPSKGSHENLIIFDIEQLEKIAKNVQEYVEKNS